MNKISKLSLLGILITILATVSSCSLKEQILDNMSSSSVYSDTTLLPNLVYPATSSSNLFWRQGVWGLEEACTDEMMFPTRGTDWYDGGVWQQMYLLQTTPQHRDVTGTWNQLSANITLCNTATYSLSQYKISAALMQRYTGMVNFMRTFYNYYMYDLWRVYPVRDPLNLDYKIPPTFYSGKSGFNKLVSDAKSALGDMISRDNAPYGEPNRDAALMLLAKLYLNEQVYTGVSGYDSCMIYTNQLINSGHYQLANDYFNMFLPTNDQNYKTQGDEAIMVAINDDQQNMGEDYNNVWVQPFFHYNQTFNGQYPSNWNGGCTTGTFLDNTWFAGTDTATDVRWKDSRFYPQMAVNIGFSYGIQYDVHGNVLTRRDGVPLNYTVDVSLTNATENQGVRVLKYYPRLTVTNPARSTNDFIIWRYADVLLMQAECLVRSTTQQNIPEAMALVNQIRTKRHAPTVSATTTADALNLIYIERGLELYWEGHRRQDMIRFGTFLGTRTDKTNVSPSTAILFPIPQSAIDGSNGTLHQNPGY